MVPLPRPHHVRCLPALLLAGTVAGCGGDAAPSSAASDAGPLPGDAAPRADTGAAVPLDAGVGAGDGGTIDRCAAVRASITAAGFGGEVSVTCDGVYAYVTSDTYPDHAKMDGITGTNDQVPVPAAGYRSPVRLAPTKAARPTSIDAALGVAVNGVPIYDYSSQGALDPSVYDARFDTVLTGELDRCGGHSGRGDDYHYHASPSCMIAAMANRGPAAILGWAFDGYPIFGDTNPDGSAIREGELDVCNGKPDATFGFRYHTSRRHPYIVQCLSGEFDVAKAPRVGPLSKQGGGGGRPPGQKAPGGVQNLRLVEHADGSRVMTYTHQGASYAIAYKPSVAPGCWDFTDRSFTTGGVEKVGTYCRAAP
jgi:hypothetical protein